MSTDTTTRLASTYPSIAYASLIDNFPCHAQYEFLALTDKLRVPCHNDPRGGKELKGPLG